MNFKPSLSVRHLSKHFQRYTDRPTSLKSYLVGFVRGRVGLGSRERIKVLNNISFDIYPGEFVGIMGANGVGKSTLLKLISGIYSPSEGQIEVNGQIAPLIELGAGFHPELSGYENIFLNGSILGYGRKAIISSLEEILEFSELGEKIHMPVKHFSSGMLARLGFSIATHLSAPIILIDEILAVGDSGFQEKCLAKIKKLHSEQRTLLLISHDASAIESNCSRCIVLSREGKVYDGPAAEGAEVYRKMFF